MKLHRGFSGGLISTSTAIVALVAQPVQAAQTEVTNVQLQTVRNGISLVLRTQGNNRPPVFTVSRGRSTVVDINDVQLRLSGNQGFQQPNPIAGIVSVTVRQLDIDTVRVTVNGTTQAPAAQVIRQDNDGRLVLNFQLVEGLGEAPSPIPPAIGQPPNAVPPFRSRAVAPPVGDIAVAPLDVSPDVINLNTDQVIPRLLLREAPVREVLTLLARAAGVNVAFAEGEGGGEGTQQAGTTATTGGPTISLDIENESVQDVFNYVLRVSNLQANRVGNTIFVGRNLPGIAQNRVVRTLRLNQIKATVQTTIIDTTLTTAQTGGSASGTSGEATVDEEGGTFSASGPSSTLALTALNRGKKSTDVIRGRGALEILQSYGANGGGEGATSDLLEGLNVVADPRLNTVTLIGTPRQVEIATSLIKQLDLRRRQVAVNVKFIDVNLLKTKDANADLLFNSGAGVGESVSASFINGVFQIGAGIGRDFLLNILGTINDQSGKILTNPTLIVQEGSSAQVNLTRQVFTGFRVNPSTVDPTTGVLIPGGREPIIQNAGVIFNVTVDRIDDNGFVTLNVTPEVSAPTGESFEDQGSQAFLLQQRRLETGQIRLRDGQTLILTGIIQDEDRINSSKVPILGDIPLLGRLFRSEEKRRQRNELVVVVTPKILDDSEQSTFGYEYTPSPEAERLLNR